MRTPFAVLESRMNAVAMDAFANAEIIFDGKGPVSGVFESQSSVALGMGGELPRLRVLDTAVSGVRARSSVTVNGVPYLVTSIKNDGIGMVSVELEEQ